MCGPIAKVEYLLITSCIWEGCMAVDEAVGVACKSLTEAWKNNGFYFFDNLFLTLDVDAPIIRY